MSYELNIQEWIERGECSQTSEIQSFIDDLIDSVPDTYENRIYITAIASVVVAQILARHFGISAVQAGYIQREWIRHWGIVDVSCGYQIREYVLMCYPQYKEMFEKTIPKSVFREMQHFCENKINTYQKLYEQYLDDLEQYEHDLAVFKERHPDYDEQPEYYSRFAHDEYTEFVGKKISGFEFAPIKPADPSPSPTVLEHWRLIIEGNIPFGYTLADHEDV